MSNTRRSASRLLAGTTGLAMLALAQPAIAQSTRATDPSTLDILEVLVDKGVLTQDDANAVLSEARKRSEQRDAVVRVPYVPESVRAAIKEEVKSDVLQTARAENWAQPGALPGWLGSFSFSGDIRARADWLNYSAGNTSVIPDVNRIRELGGVNPDEQIPFLNTSEDRFRTRIRARFGVDARIATGVTAGLRIVSGDLSDPTSTSQTLSPNFSRLAIGLDRAYIRVAPFEKNPRLAGTHAVVGKFDNPFLSTELLWDRDVQFDGAAVTASLAFGDDPGSPRVFATGGAFPLDEISSVLASPDKFLYAAQIGGSYSPTAAIDLSLAAALYNFDNVRSQFNTTGLRDNDETTPRRVQFGNSLFNIRRDNAVPNTVLFGLASKYRVAAITAHAAVDLTDSVAFSIDAEAARNLAFDETELRGVYGVPASSGDTAWLVRGTFGHPRLDKAGNWQISGTWRRLEADSTLDLFTDSDFGIGGTDQEGYSLFAGYSITDRLQIEGRWYSARTIDQIDPLNDSAAASVDTDTAFIDLTAKF